LNYRISIQFSIKQKEALLLLLYFLKYCSLQFVTCAFFGSNKKKIIYRPIYTH